MMVTFVNVGSSFQGRVNLETVKPLLPKMENLDILARNVKRRISTARKLFLKNLIGRMGRKILARFSLPEIIEYPNADLMSMCLGNNIINNPNAVRFDDPITGDIIFYEPKPKDSK